MPTRSSVARQRAATRACSRLTSTLAGKRAPVDRQDDVDDALLAGTEAHVVAQHRIGEAIGVVDAQRLACRQRLREPIDDRPGRGRLDANAARRPQRAQAQRAIDPEGAAVPLQGLDRAGAAAMGEKLRRRIHLEGPPGERERESARPLSGIAHPVANDRSRLVGRAVAEGGDVEAEIADAPVGSRHGQVTVAQGVADAGVGPARDAPVADEKRLESADPGHRLDRAVLAQQRSHAAAVDAEDGPVRLLADVGARIRAASATARRYA